MCNLTNPRERGGAPAGAKAGSASDRAGALLALDARYHPGRLGGGMQRMSSVPMTLFAAAWMLLGMGLSGCVGPESDSSEEAIDEASSSIVEADELAFEQLGEESANDTASRVLDPFSNPVDGSGSALPSPGDLRAEPEPDPWNPGGDPTKKLGPNDT